MKYFSRLIIFILFVIFFTCCENKNKEIENAKVELLHIKHLIDINSYDSAKILIDSFHSNNRQLIDSRKIAQSYSDTISRIESSRILNLCDSILPLKKQESENLMKNFVLEKDDKFQTIGNYVHKHQLTEQNTQRNYLKYYFDEKANLFLVSNYIGSKLNHKSIKVTSDDLFIETRLPSTTDTHLHTFTDGINNYEQLTIDSISDNGVAEFILKNKTNSIKITLQGNKNSRYFLSVKDINAICDTYKFWLLKKEINKLELEQKKASHKLNRIILRNNI